ncbi:hypothetical protein E2C01_035479 [Portunus trituberculatus]|uniref:Uncharacterized protein n=1 Tax=Portunus trituberculatus TaxID=210409 RepID=A0A5B7F3A0_PORTR|nr:hypothetical protein [Portunus trituberculatus]
MGRAQGGMMGAEAGRGEERGRGVRRGQSPLPRYWQRLPDTDTAAPRSLPTFAAPGIRCLVTRHLRESVALTRLPMMHYDLYHVHTTNTAATTQVMLRWSKSGGEVQDPNKSWLPPLTQSHTSFAFRRRCPQRHLPRPLMPVITERAVLKALSGFERICHKQSKAQRCGSDPAECCL